MRYPPWAWDAGACTAPIVRQRIKESLATLEKVLDLFFDTADVYDHGPNESPIARVWKNRRKEVEIVTKFGCIGDYNATVCGTMPKTFGMWTTKTDKVEIWKLVIGIWYLNFVA